MTTDLESPQAPPRQTRDWRRILIIFMVVVAVLTGVGFMAYVVFFKHSVEQQQLLRDGSLQRTKFAEAYTRFCAPEPILEAVGAKTYSCALFVKVDDRVVLVTSVTVRQDSLRFIGIQYPLALDKREIPLQSLPTPEALARDSSLLAAPVHSNYGVLAQVWMAQRPPEAPVAVPPPVDVPLVPPAPE